MGIYAKNREEFAVVNLSSLRSDVTIVPFFDSLGLQALQYIIDQCELITMCVDLKGFTNLMKLRETGIKSLKNIVCFDELSE